MIPRFALSLPCLLFCSVATLAEEPGSPTQWNYENYRKSYPDQVCRVRTSQSGHRELQPVVEFCPSDELKATNAAQLRASIRQAWRGLLGPSERNLGPLRLRELETNDFPRYVRKKIEYEADAGEPVRAWLFIPKTKTQPKAPAMLCLHQTVREGKDQAAGLDPKTPELAFGPALAEMGYVTLCPDVICFGERYQVGGSFYCHYGDAVRIYQGNAGRSILSKMIDDVLRAVDLLSTLPQVDPERIGSIGHSHGGYGTLFAMAFDERIKAGVVSCGFTCFRADPTPDRWFRKTALMPRLGGFEGKMEETPVDFHHLFAAIAPRALFISAALKDSVFPGVGDVDWIRKDLQSMYAREAAAENFELYAFDGAHAFTPEARDRAWAFLNDRLNPPPRRLKPQKQALER
jgi:dienelactone hydrolase